jgi:hypothetical protein
MSTDAIPAPTAADLAELQRNFNAAGTDIERHLVILWFCKRHGLTVDQLNALYRPAPKEVT